MVICLMLYFHKNQKKFITCICSTTLLFIFFVFKTCGYANYLDKVNIKEFLFSSITKEGGKMTAI